MDWLIICTIESFSERNTVYCIINENGICPWTRDWWVFIFPNNIDECHTINTKNYILIINEFRWPIYSLLLIFQWARRCSFCLSIRIVSTLFMDTISIMCTIHLGKENYPWYSFHAQELWYPMEILFLMHERFQHFDPYNIKINSSPCRGLAAVIFGYCVNIVGSHRV